MDDLDSEPRSVKPARRSRSTITHTIRSLELRNIW